jgi:Domain of unknown function (DUF4190)
MTNPSDQPFRGIEYPSLENAPRPDDPNAPVDYPTGYPPLPPPVYPQPSGYPGYPGSYPGYPGGYPGYPGGYPGYPGGYPGYGGVDPYDPYRMGKPPGTNGKATAALVTSLAGLLFCGLPSIAGLILGIIAMRECRRTGQDGHGIALAGTIIGGIVVAFWIVYLVGVFLYAATFAPSYPT